MEKGAKGDVKHIRELIHKEVLYFQGEQEKHQSAKR